MEIYQKIMTYLDSKSCPYKEIDHQTIETCEDSASARGMDIKYGGKTLMFKAKDTFHLFTLPADKNVDSNRVRKILGTNKLRFANSDELLEFAGVVKGALPPFGKEIYPYDWYMDNTLRDLEYIAFCPGRTDKSLVIEKKDYFNIVNPVFENFIKA